MLKKTMTYVDFNGDERTEEFYFNLTQAELMEMEMGTTGGWAERMQQIVNAKDLPLLAKVFKEIILKAYGEKSPDGRRLVKSAALSEAFSQTNAYSDLFIELLSKENAATEFIQGLMPKMDNVNAPSTEVK